MSSSVDPEMMALLKEYKKQKKVHDEMQKRAEDKEVEDFQRMWYEAFPEQKNSAAYLKYVNQNIKS